MSDQGQVSQPSTESVQEIKQPIVPDYKGTKHKVKTYGQESEVDYDELVRGYTHGKAAEEKFSKADKIQKQVDALFGGLKQKDLGALKKLASAVGEKEFRELAENYLLEHIEFERLPDSDKARIAAEKRARELEDRLNEKEKESIESQREQAKNVAMQEIDTEISEALKLYPKSLPDESKTLVAARIVERMIANLQSKGAKLPAAKAAELEFKGLERELKGFLASKSVEDLRTLLPKNLLDGLRKADVELARGQFPKSGKTQLSDQPNSKKPKRTSTESWFEEMEKRLG